MAVPKYTTPEDMALHNQIKTLEDRVKALESGASLGSSSIGRGGLRIRGGILRIQDIVGDDMFRAGGDPGELFLSRDLLSPLAIAIFADRMLSSPVIFTEFDNEYTTSTSYTDLTTVGPTISNIEVSASGKMLVIMNSALVPAVNDSAAMSFEITGDTEQPPSDGRILALLRGTEFIAFTTATVIPVTGLNPGVHQVQAKYRSDFGNDLGAGFNNRGLTVIAF